MNSGPISFATDVNVESRVESDSVIKIRFTMLKKACRCFVTHPMHDSVISCARYHQMHSSIL